MLLVPQMGWNSGPPPAPPASLSFLGYHTITGDGTSYNFNASDFGAEAADRAIIVGFGASHSLSRTLNEFVIGGTECTRYQVNSGFSASSGFGYRTVPTGTTNQSVRLTFNNTVLRCVIGVWRATGLLSTTPVDGGNAALNSSPISGIDIQSGGINLLFNYINAASPTNTYGWGGSDGYTKRTGASLESAAFYEAADFVATQSGSFDASWTSTETSGRMHVASWR